ncbi:MAG TPA: sortase [Chloroflexia bacterium]|nr:sortase [Chloroflexia bacterium]
MASHQNREVHKPEGAGNFEARDPDLIGLQDFLLSEAPVKPTATAQELSVDELEALLVAKRSSASEVENKAPVKKAAVPKKAEKRPVVAKPEDRFAPATLVTKKTAPPKGSGKPGGRILNIAGYTLEALVIVAALWIFGSWALQQAGIAVNVNLFDSSQADDFKVLPSRPEGVYLSAYAPNTLDLPAPPSTSAPTATVENEVTPQAPRTTPTQAATAAAAVAPTPTPAIVQAQRQTLEEGAAPPPSPPRRLQISKLGIDTPVKEVTVNLGTWQVADFAAGHHRGTAMPGQAGNMVLVGHRDIRGSVFLRLNELQVGDEFKVTTDNAVYRYVVTSTFEVAPTQVEVMAPTTDPTATLITCTPVGLATKRLIVKARLEK